MDDKFKYIKPEGEYKLKSFVGVLLVNLGTPQEPTASSIRTYLREFLSDRRIVELNPVLWKFILNGFVLPFRPKQMVPKYKEIWAKYNKSPLLYHTENLRENLDEYMPSFMYVAHAMTYGEPSIKDALEYLRQRLCGERVIVVPLYPQFSASTTGAVFDAVARTVKEMKDFPELRFIKSYYRFPEYIECIANSIKAYWAENGQPDRLLCSFHGLPQSMIDAGDPYYSECLHTVELIKAALPQDGPQVDIAFQSKFGREKWIEPSSESVIRSYPSQGVKNLHVIAPGFAVDCIETIDEIDRELRDVFMNSGGEKFGYIPCLNSSEEWCETLNEIVYHHIFDWRNPCSD
ncbi:ferrochelatase [Taylorella equigenitalis]|uniref:ferrochelatase n=1 Tax=Taylorella equigenitalis TaxID=29575 RepID=UPI00040314C0|nr:ferrochelatase [Taylorella equigenitalis]ASY41122.1 ferrochelatase [Taylorella equigenitalis]